jgi:carbonic anhydrase
LPEIMRLLEAIIDANHRAAAGDQTAGLHPAEFEDSLPIIALTCIDPRLNPLMPEVLGIPETHFIWLRNAGNIITGPLSSTTRSLALACAVKGGREIVIIGHTDCLVCRTSMMELTDRLKALGVERTRLPENLTEYFGLFASERQNVLKAAEFVGTSPLIGPRVPVHGLLVDIESGRLEWLVNGYQALEAASSKPAPASLEPGAAPLDALTQMLPFNLGEMRFPEGKIGELATKAGDIIGRVEHAATRAEHLAGKAGEFAEKVGNLADKARDWLNEVQLHTHEAGPPPASPPALKLQSPKAPPHKPIPVPPPIRRAPRPSRGGKPSSG